MPDTADLPGSCIAGQAIRRGQEGKACTEDTTRTKLSVRRNR
jgi:hypothetical protein